MFISLDGEGIGDKFVLLCAANTDGSVKRSIEDEAGLDTKQCIDFLLQLSEDYEDAHFIGFSFSYDVNMILYPLLSKTIGYAKHLATNKRLRFQLEPKRHIEVRIFGRKMTTIREYIKSYDGKKSTGRSIKIDDVFGFYQSSFLKALQKEGMATDEIMERIEAGKQHRAGGFDGMISDEVKQYCFDECMSLSQMVDKLANAIKSAGLQNFQHYHGAGAIAQAFMRKYHLERHVIHDETFGSEIANVIRHAYFGGRTDCFKQGYFTTPTVQYDINSAYPTETLQLPSLAGGSWVEYKGASDKLEAKLAELPYALVHVSWDIGAPTAENNLVPFPVRFADGTVHYLHNAVGWYWTVEVMAALRHFPTSLKIDKILAFIPKNIHTQPFSFVDQIAKLRFQAKAAGLASEKVYKLGMNSLYGKCAQKQYGARTPQFQSLVWAGLITAGTRAKILDMTAPYKQYVIAIATDGVIYASDPQLPTGTQLGELDKKTYGELLYLQPGVYFIDGAQGTPKTRGHLLADLNYDYMLDQWLEYGPNMEYEYVSRRFVAMGLANHWNRWNDWCQWIDFPRTVRCRIRDKLPANVDLKYDPTRYPSNGGIFYPLTIHDGRPIYDLYTIPKRRLLGFHSLPYTGSKAEIADSFIFNTPSLLHDFVAATQPAIPTLF